ncbi:type II toxin-antitoxin system VapC family toxin [Microcoleus sp. w2-18bC1]|uniref:type II toxin-antitoxin system VapC family toxin n=1 Tax=unclassified Microcoleus TaxID=2642155 RepID=UPI002FD4006A
MSLYILDTNCFSELQKKHPVMVQRVEVNAENLAVTIVTVEEAIRGWFDFIRKASTSSQADKLVWGYTRLWDTLDDFKNLNILKFDQNAFTIYTEFRRQKIRISTQDLRIAAIVLANNAILVTRNKQDFEKVPGLVQEDWTIQP